MLTDRDAMPAALALALADRHVDVETQPSPDGTLRLDRAATAQHAAIASAADAGVWIDADEVWVVSADGRLLRHARVPEDATPRTFAAITASPARDEVYAPVANVHVDVQPPSAPPPPPASPSAYVVNTGPTAVHAIGSSRGAPQARALVEIGPTATPATIGAELELAFPLSRNVRFGLLGGVNQMFDGIGDYQNGTQLLL